MKYIQQVTIHSITQLCKTHKGNKTQRNSMNTTLLAFANKVDATAYFKFNIFLYFREIYDKHLVYQIINMLQFVNCKHASCKVVEHGGGETNV